MQTATEINATYTARINDAIAAIRAAQDAWIDCTWTTTDDDGREVEHSDEYRQQVADDASRAAEHGDNAICHIEAGDIASALEEVETAASIERKYGDSPAWTPAALAVQSIAR
jgi:hypothetical protein